MKSSKKVPLWVGVCDSIRAEIISEKLKPGMKLPPDNELYKKLNVSKPTVIRALDELKKEGIIVRKRGSGTFVADKKQRPLIQDRTLKIAILSKTYITKDFSDESFANAVVRGILGEWNMLENTPTVSHDSKNCVLHLIWKSKNVELEIDYFGESGIAVERHPPKKSLLNKQYDGFICLGIIEEHFLNFLLEFDIPIVLADYPQLEFECATDQVYADPNSAMKVVIKKIINGGFSKIHFVGALEYIPPGDNFEEKSRWSFNNAKMRVEADSWLRMNAFRYRMELEGLKVPNKNIHFASQDKGQIDLIISKLSKLARDNLPEVIICNSNLWACMLREAFEKKSIPIKVIPIAGFDLKDNGAYIHVDGKEMGRVAADLLVSRLLRPNRPFLKVGVRMEFRE